MAKTKISEFSSTPSNNTDIDGINIAEGMAPSNVNNAIRELMSQLKDWQSGAVAQDMTVNGGFTATGNAVLSADLAVAGKATVTGNATIGGAVTCTGATVLSSTLNVAGATTVGGDVVMSGKLSVAGATSLGAVTCSGAAVMSSTLAVNGSASLNGNATLGTSTTNTVTMNALLSAGGGTGTSGQYLKSRGTSDAPIWDNVNTLTASTAKASTSGTNIEFTGIPSWVKRITVMISGVSTNGTTDLIVQIGAGTFVTSGYSSGLLRISAATVYTTGFGIAYVGGSGAAYLYSGSVTLTNVSGNTWVESGVTVTPSNAAYCSAGTVTISGTLDRVRVTSVGGDTFDAGTINILYE